PWRSSGLDWPVCGEPRGEGEDVTAVLSTRDERRVDAGPDALFDLTFEAPPAVGEGRTTTLLVTIHGASPSWPPGAGAPRQPSAIPEPAMFHDVAQALGAEFVHFEGPDLQLDIRPTMGPGAAWGDVDGDGWVDLFLPQGGGREGSEPPTSRFFRNVDGKRFV